MECQTTKKLSMKKYILILLISPLFTLSQSIQDLQINQYKYMVVKETRGMYERLTRKHIVKNIEYAGYKVINLKSPRQTYTVYPNDLIENPNLALYISASVSESYGNGFTISILFRDHNGQIKFARKVGGYSLLSKGIKASISEITSYNYRYSPMLGKILSSKNELKPLIDFSSEKSIRNCLDTMSNLDKYEGIYTFTSTKTQAQYKFVILKNNFIYYGYIIEANCVGCNYWNIGDIKFKMSEASIEGLFDVTWKFPKAENKRDEKGLLYSELNGGLLKSDNMSLIKLYPKLNNIKNKTGQWTGNGSGIIISKSGYIITNFHVIKDAKEINVEFLINSELKKYNAQIIQVDKINDLAIIKILDVNFEGLTELSYNFKAESSDVGTKVYAYGYPMALSGMGEEIKVTDGIISSKTGFDGNITTYQISAPIQGGNSGGPLFDSQGNFLGINSSGIRKDIADNVGYTIKSSYVANLIDILPKTMALPSNTKLKGLELTEQIKEISKYVVLIKIK